MARIIALAGRFGRIAWEDEKPAGFVLARDLGDECEILSLGVVPERRRRGTGSALLAAIGEEAGRRGGHRVVLEVAADNDAARALYSTSGFIQVGSPQPLLPPPGRPGRRAGAPPHDRVRPAFDLSSRSPSSALPWASRIQPNVTRADLVIARNRRSSTLPRSRLLLIFSRAALIGIIDMDDTDQTSDLLALTTEIVAAHVSNNTVAVWAICRS